MNKLVPAAALTAGLVIAASPALAQAIGGGGGGGGIGDTIFNWFFQNFMHAVAAAGIIAILVGALFMRSHLIYFVVAGMSLLAIGNYSTILGWAGL